MIQRLQEIFRDDTIRLTFMGGSVSEGYPYDERVKNPYPEIIANSLQRLYPEKNILINNLACCGEKSVHALLKIDSELKKTDKQVVFLEYALNDDANGTFVKVFESLLRKLINMPGQSVIATVILPFGKNSMVAEYVRKLSCYYQIPCFDLAAFVGKKIAEENFQWKQYSFDKVHPGQWGHDLIADFVVKTIQKELKRKLSGGKDYQIPSKAYFCSPYEKMRVIQPKSVFPMTMEVECSTVWLSYIKHNENYMGKLQVYVDGELLCNLHGKSFYCWKYPEQIKLFEKEQIEKHTITFQMAPADLKKKFIIEYIGIC